MFDRACLAALSAVLNTGSFDRAAAQLNVSQSAVSQRIRTLEDRVGATLVRRTRPVTATPAGRRLQAHAETLALMERDVGRALRMTPAVPDTPLRIAVTADTVASWLLPALPREDGLFYDLIIDDQDHSADLLQSGEAAGAITARDAPIAGCDVTPLGSLRYVAFAAPAFARTHFPAGVDLAGLRSAPALSYSRKDRLQRDWASRAAGVEIRRLPTHYLPSTHGITAAAIGGLGWSLNPEELIGPHFDSGALVPIGPGITLETPLFWQVPRQNRAVLAGLTQSLVRGAKRRRAADQSGQTRRIVGIDTAITSTSRGRPMRQ